VYVTNSDTVSVIDTATNAVVTTIAVGDTPVGVAVAPNGGIAYVTNFLSQTVSMIDTATNAVVATVALTGGPSGVLPGWGQRLCDEWSGRRVCARYDDQCSGINDPVGSVPSAVAVSPNGARLYMTNLGCSGVPGLEVGSRLSGVGAGVRTGSATAGAGAGVTVRAGERPTI
jgi:YVTN family beta-propeller protein